MTNLDKHEWDFSKGEKYCIRWMDEHGYALTIRKRFISKDYCTMEKDGHAMEFDPPLGDEKINYKRVMEGLESQFSMSRELVVLREAAAGVAG